ncbi:DNA-binding transcriptional regulator Cro [Pseudomonas cedrina]|uniref:DNA-binding transcriptional regulator Cro n=1 Tax=Pseudomonas cedrina TaxID=651740 RepID=A0ABY0UZF1_PSECE|nr:Cro/CI family transcriptional regulator [Pseudomonas cedrina]SDT42616.1 DNA-binding transcriptional regulator Cro [Pseudomonas cedrina]
MAVNISALINHFGSQSKTGEALGVSQATVSYWLSGLQKVSPEKALLAEIVTHGAIKASALCDLIAQVEARHKVGEYSSEFPISASGPHGSVCASSIEVAP